MSSRQQIDSVIDDDDEFCPLCIEEFDLSDKNFRPCPCGYQICQFCYNNIKTHSEEGRCPNCRRSYDDSTIEYKIPDAEEFKADLALKHRKAAAAKKKESEKREIESSSRKNLAGVRVVQKNLVYVIGLNPTIRDESQLLQTLRGREYFGQYGDIEKIVVSKAKPGGNQHQGIGVYVTFSRKVDAATCIAAVDGSPNGDRVLRAQYGTTKYCSSFLRNEQCNNRNCTFLHETGEDSESYSRSDLSSMNTLSSQRQQHPNAVPGRPAQPITHTMRRQPSKDDSISGRSAVPDGPALPSSASWANKDNSIKARRPSLTGSQTSQSPRPASVNVSTLADEAKRSERPSPTGPEARTSSQPDEPSPTSQAEPPKTKSSAPPPSPFNALIKDLMSPDFKFVFSTAELSDDEVKAIQNFPPFIDPYGGLKRRAMREKAERERVSREQEILQSAAAEDSREAGSLQLGGEPEDANPTRGNQSRESHGAIQPPSTQGTADNSTVGSPVSASSHQFQGLNLAGRSLTPLQQQQLMLLKSAGNQQAGLSDPMSSAALDQAAQARQGALQSQLAQYNALQAQGRQSSRFSFTNDATTKNIGNARMLSQMQPGTPNPLTAPSPQHALSSGFYGSGVQGPPPGLKTAGTPPISGGGMFAQGHGFTANANVGVGKQDATPELMRELLRGRGGTNVGSVQGQEASKLDEEFPPLGGHLKDHQSVDTFGFLKSQISRDSGSRSGTPTVPPGLSLPHGHPASAFQEQRDASKPSSPAPLVPPGLGALSREVSPSQSRSQSPGVNTQLRPEVRSKAVSEISLGSPVAKSARKPRLDMTIDSITPSASTAKDVSKLESPMIAKASPVSLNMPFSAQDAPSAKSERPLSGTFPPAPGSVSAIGSRPNTPLTTASRISDSSAPRQPRVLRVVETPKPEGAVPVAKAPSVAASATGPTKYGSRRQSLSSTSRPDSPPGDFGSEADTYASASVSRANSPPPANRIGSAPVRAMTKSQVKKERRQKAKEAEAKKAEVTPAPEEPVQAPIIGRKRKTKKAPSGNNDTAAISTPPTANVSPIKTEREVPKVTDTKPEPAPAFNAKEQPAPPPQEHERAKAEVETKEKVKNSVVEKPADQPDVKEPWQSHNTMKQLAHDAEKTTRPLRDLFSERTKPLHEMLANMHSSLELDLHKNSLFNPANLSQRTDMKCNARDYDPLKRPTELNDEHRQALRRGEPVRVGSDQLKNRCLITPRGCVLRHLDPEDEEQYLELEKKKSGIIDPFVVGDDSSNIHGGIEALFTAPEKYNILWVDEAAPQAGNTTTSADLDSQESVIPPNVLSAMEADTSRNHDWAVAQTAELMQTTTAAVRSFAAATAKQMLGTSSVPGFNPSLDDVAAMTDEELKELATKSHKDLESTRKELDMIDKKFNALLRRNRKIQQQSISAIAES